MTDDIQLARTIDGWLEEWYAQERPRTPTRGAHIADALLAEFSIVPRPQPGALVPGAQALAALMQQVWFDEGDWLLVAKAVIANSKHEWPAGVPVPKEPQ